jgi:hypothetical protein
VPLCPVSGAQPVCEPLPPALAEASATEEVSLDRTTSPRPREVNEVVSESLTPGTGEATATRDASLNEKTQPVPPGVGETTATQDAPPNGTTQPATPDISDRYPPSVGEASTSHDASLNGTTPKLPDPSLQHEQIFRRFIMHRVPNATQGAPHLGMSMLDTQRRQIYGFSNNFDLWMYRIRKECGPITDRALHVDCVRSFRAQYPLHHARPMKGAGDLEYRSSRHSWSSAARQ